MIRRTRGATYARRLLKARDRRWSISTVVFALLAVLSATTAQRVKQLARELEVTKRYIQEAESRNAKPLDDDTL